MIITVCVNLVTIPPTDQRGGPPPASPAPHAPPGLPALCSQQPAWWDPASCDRSPPPDLLSELLPLMPRRAGDAASRRTHLCCPGRAPPHHRPGPSDLLQEGPVAATAPQGLCSQIKGRLPHQSPTRPGSSGLLGSEDRQSRKGRRNHGAIREAQITAALPRAEPAGPPTRAFHPGPAPRQLPSSHHLRSGMCLSLSLSFPVSKMEKTACEMPSVAPGTLTESDSATAALDFYSCSTPTQTRDGDQGSHCHLQGDSLVLGQGKSDISEGADSRGTGLRGHALAPGAGVHGASALPQSQQLCPSNYAEPPQTSL